MTGPELKALSISLFGPKRWQKEVAAYLRIDVSTVRRMVTEAVRMPGPVGVAMEALIKERTNADGSE